MNTANLKFLVAAVAIAAAANASAQITFYEHEGFRGEAFAADRQIDDFRRTGFNDRASSVVVDRGHWEVCQDARFEGRCVVLQRGSYDSLRGLGLDRQISSVRPVEDRDHYDNQAPQPLPQPLYEYRRRPEEEVYRVPVSSVRAVMGSPEQRCWVERERVPETSQRDLNVPGGIIGGLLGGVIGHQFGGGRGNTATTIGGAVGALHWARMWIGCVTNKLDKIYGIAKTWLARHPNTGM